MATRMVTVKAVNAVRIERLMVNPSEIERI
jgi:hypothetical protein